MKQVKKTAEYIIFERNDKRHAIKGNNGKFINGDEKVEILQKEGLLKKPEPKKAEESAEETSAGEEPVTTEEAEASE